MKTIKQNNHKYVKKQSYLFHIMNFMIYISNNCFSLCCVFILT